MKPPLKNEVRKPTKTISGISPIAVMLPPRKCEHGTCLYCPSLDSPQSYTPKSPAVMRAMLLKYDPFKQVSSRLMAFKAMHHPTDKVELIIMGGTFLQYDEKFQGKFVKACYDALNGKVSKSLEYSQKLNEKAKHRCIALCIETRPDVCSDELIKKMREYGATRVEFGVQMPDDEIYKKIKRGHKVKDVVDATRRLKDAGFKVGYHIMPGLPGSNPKKDLELFKKVFSDERFKPDQLKIYPCQVLKGAELEKDYWKGKYKPYTKEQINDILVEMLKIIPRYCRVMRIMREIHPDYIIAGTTKIDMRKDVEEKLRREGVKLEEIRYREIGFQKETDANLKLKITRYKASGGEEYFLEIINNHDILFGLLRLRIFNDVKKEKKVNVKNSKLINSDGLIINNLKKSATKGAGNSSRAIIRELHVYGKSLKLGERGKKEKGVQHKGLGKWLMQQAEFIVSQEEIKELRVISGVGVREYYRKLGYKLESRENGEYMVKVMK